MSSCCNCRLSQSSGEGLPTYTGKCSERSWKVGPLAGLPPAGGGSKDNEDGDAQCDPLALDGREVHPVPAVLLGHASLQADQGNLISVGRPSIVRWPAKTKFLHIQLVAKIARLCAHECRLLFESDGIDLVLVQVGSSFGCSATLLQW